MPEHHYQIAFNFIEQEPRAAAQLLETKTAQEIYPFLTNTPAPMVANLLHEMQAEFAAELLQVVDNDTAHTWTNYLDARTLSTILRRCNLDQQQIITDGLSLKKKGACQLLLSFRDDMVGAIMATDIIAFATDMRVDDCIGRLKRRQYGEQQLAFSVDTDKKLVGELCLTKLLQANKNSRVGELDIPCASIPGRTTISSALSHPAWHGRDILPVINRQKELLGVLHHSQIRESLTTPITQSKPPDAQYAAADIVHAHGDCMRALADVILRAR